MTTEKTALLTLALLLIGQVVVAHKVQQGFQEKVTKIKIRPLIKQIRLKDQFVTLQTIAFQVLIDAAALNIVLEILFKFSFEFLIAVIFRMKQIFPPMNLLDGLIVPVMPETLTF